jgi:hypothetical protein
MPIKSKQQMRLMEGVANNPEFAKKVGINPEVGKEFIDATPKETFKKLKERVKKKKNE